MDLHHYSRGPSGNAPPSPLGINSMVCAEWQPTPPCRSVAPTGTDWLQGRTHPCTHLPPAPTDQLRCGTCRTLSTITAPKRRHVPASLLEHSAGGFVCRRSAAAAALQANTKAAGAGAHAVTMKTYTVRAASASPLWWHARFELKHSAQAAPSLCKGITPPFRSRFGDTSCAPISGSESQRLHIGTA